MSANDERETRLPVFSHDTNANANANASSLLPKLPREPLVLLQVPRRHRRPRARQHLPEVVRRDRRRMHPLPEPVLSGWIDFKGVRGGVERRRGVSGLKARDPGRR
eukprot:31494-Pelagococcus_subviridis.AAC.15